NCHDGHPFNHNQSAGVDLPNDFDIERGKSEAYAAEKFAIKNERPRWNIKDNPCPHSKTHATKPLPKPSLQVLPMAIKSLSLAAAPTTKQATSHKAKPLTSTPIGC